MYLDKFAETVLALLVTFNQNAGNSPYSFEPAPACGTDQAKATCPLEPRCAVQSWQCVPPRWSDSRSAWVVPESKAAAYRRYKTIAASVARVAFLHARCKDQWGVVIERCRPSGWPEGPETLAMVAAVTAIHESGLREDIQFGLPPMGRGPDGEGCLVQVMPSQIAQFASWVPPDEKALYERSLAPKRKELEEQWVARMLGDSPESLDRCFDTGLRMLAHARRACSSAGRWPYGMWSMYGTGRTCAATQARPGAKQSWAEERASMFYRMRSSRPLLPPEARTLLGMGVATPEPPGPVAEQ
jgi:hypothetical protein